MRLPFAPTLIFCLLWMLGLMGCVSQPTPGPSDLSLTPGELSLEVGQQQQLEARWASAPERRIESHQVTWRSSNPEVLEVGPDGLVTAKAEGQASVEASVGNSSSRAIARIRLPSRNSISGTVQIAGAAPAVAQAEFVPGEVIVKFKPSVGLQSVGRLSAGGVELRQVRTLALPEVYLYQASLDGYELLQAVAELQRRADVEYAQPNYLRYARFTPNDPYYRLQWHYTAMRLPEAWDLERGTTNPVTVGVIDSGIYSVHPDLAGKLLPGYDFVRDTGNGDGDGRDPNPEDPPVANNNYHGTHVAGTIAAASDNRVGVAGVSFGARILPVRSLGVRGGNSLDVVDGMLWAAGFNTGGNGSSLPSNPNPAQVLNLSLGGDGPCSPMEQDAINRIVARGISVVVAAGNETQDARNSSPANCNSVITVGATDFANRRTSYSNYGSTVDVMAPGGDTRADLNRDGFPDGVLSLIRPYNTSLDLPNDGLYAFYPGTSMAAPHVAGLVALMKSRQPSLTPAQLEEVLRRTATPLSASACNRPSGADCGAGLVNALEALRALDGNPNPNPGPNPSLSLSLTPASLTLSPGGSASLSLTINRSNLPGAVSLSAMGLPQGVTAVFSPASTEGNSSRLELRTAATVAPGNYTLSIEGRSSSTSARVNLPLNISSAPQVSLEGTILYALFWDGNDYDLNRSRWAVLSTNRSRSGYTLPSLVAGQYGVMAWKDTNNNDELDPGDHFGYYGSNGNARLVRPGQSGIDFSLELEQGSQHLPQGLRRGLEGLHTANR